MSPLLKLIDLKLLFGMKGISALDYISEKNSIKEIAKNPDKIDQ